MNVLVVEDDEFKASDLIKAVEELDGEWTFERAGSVTSALRKITREPIELCLLDMSLPTFDLSGPGGGGSPQSQGGIDVLRLAKRLLIAPPIIIVTQYPDIEINGKDIPVADAGAALRKEFKARVIGCLKYEFGGTSWKDPLKALVWDLVGKKGG